MSMKTIEATDVGRFAYKSIRIHQCRFADNFFEKLGFQDKIFIKDTILFIPSKVLGDFKANKVR